MKKSILFVSVLSILLITSCTSMKEKKEQIISRENREVPDFSKGILTEEILWYFGRVTTPKLSPDEQQLLFGVKYFDYHANKGNLELYTMPITGGEPIKITTTAQDEIEAIWRPDGKKIAYLFPDKEGVLQIWESNPDGKELKQISHEKSDITAFSYSPTQSHIMYSQNVRLDPTIAERYPDLPEANAKIYDDLMYRHWNSWADGTY
ncbi:MAG TPA: peptidase S9, partial [Bacteroidales bacterium]|nr:peptidase S9 [Bacteroidales bacterium]